MSEEEITTFLEPYQKKIKSRHRGLGGIGRSVFSPDLGEFYKSFKKSVNLLSQDEIEGNQTIIYLGDIPINISKKGKNILTYLQPYKHSITTAPYADSKMFQRRKKGGTNAFFDLLSVLNHGFVSPLPDETPDWGNSYLITSKRNLDKKKGDWGSYSDEKNILKGDKYQIEVIPEKADLSRGNITSDPIILSAKNKDVLGINIFLGENSSDKEKQKKINFYKKQITNKYNLPVRFYDSSKDDARIFPKKKNIESKLQIIIGIGGLIMALFFLSPNLTGNAVGNLGSSDSNLMGILLFVLGLALVYIWRKK